MSDEPEQMKIPDVIMYNGFPIRTEYIKNLLTDRELYGEYCTRMMKIGLEPEQCPERMGLTYCHEYVEAIINICHLDITDESIKQDLAVGVYQILMQHEKFFGKNKADGRND